MSFIYRFLLKVLLKEEFHAKLAARGDRCQFYFSSEFTLSPWKPIREALLVITQILSSRARAGVDFISPSYQLAISFLRHEQHQTLDSLLSDLARGDQILWPSSSLPHPPSDTVGKLQRSGRISYEAMDSFKRQWSLDLMQTIYIEEKACTLETLTSYYRVQTFQRVSVNIWKPERFIDMPHLVKLCFVVESGNMGS